MKHFLSLFTSILMSALIAAWFSQNPINAYWQQTYHRNSPLEPLAAYGWWQTGAALQENAYAFSDGIKAFLSGETPTTAQDGGSTDMPLKPPHPKPPLKPAKSKNGNRTPTPPPSEPGTKSFSPAIR